MGERATEVATAPKATLAGAPSWRDWARWFPSVRLVWIFLGLLIAIGGGQSSAAGALAWGAVLAVAVGVDLVAQFARFGRSLRFPDAALATGMFLVILVEPANVVLGSGAQALGFSVLPTAAATILLRHLVRRNGRPWFNPTALGLTMGFALFGLPMGWGIGAWPAPHMALSKEVEMGLMLLLGAVVLARERRVPWLSLLFFVTAVPLEAVALAAQGGAAALGGPALGLVLLSPATVFFGLWMVSEPRTSPSSPRHRVWYAILVGVFYVALAALWTLPVPALTAHQAWSAIDPFLALLLGNLYAVATRRRAMGGPTAVGRASTSRHLPVRRVLGTRGAVGRGGPRFPRTLNATPSRSRR